MVLVSLVFVFFFFKQKTAYEMRISDWSSDVCSSDLVRGAEALDLLKAWGTGHPGGVATLHARSAQGTLVRLEQLVQELAAILPKALIADAVDLVVRIEALRAARCGPAHAQVTGTEEPGGSPLLSTCSFSRRGRDGRPGPP